MCAKMSKLLDFIVSVCVSIVFFHSSECQVIVTNLNGTFLCGYNTRLECAIPGYGGGMSWKLDETIIAQCAFGSCAALGAMPSGDMLTPNETAKMFYLDIGITHADNGTMYQCDDGVNQDQTTVNIQVPPSKSAFTMTVSVTGTTLNVEAGCFFPSDAGKMDVYCVNGGTEIKVGNTISMTPTTTGCTGDCAGPNIYTATGTANVDNSTGSSSYRVKVYLDGFESYAISKDTPAIYNCGTTTTTTETIYPTPSTPHRSSTTETTISSVPTTESSNEVIQLLHAMHQEVTMKLDSCIKATNRLAAAEEERNRVLNRLLSAIINI